MSRKALRVFEILKRKAKVVNKVGFDPRLPEHEEPDYNRMRQEAMKSLHLSDEVEKTEEGFVVT